MNVMIVYYGLHLLAEGAVEFLFSSPTMVPFSGTSLYVTAGGKSGDISAAAGQSGPLFAASQRQSQGWGGDGLSVTGRGGGLGRKVVSELAVCQRSGRLQQS